jgi:hypothetical protein
MVSYADLRTQLASTDYGNFLANEQSPIATSTIADKALKILVDQFSYVRTNAVAPLDKFLDYITYVRLCTLEEMSSDYRCGVTYFLQLCVYDRQPRVIDHRDTSQAQAYGTFETMSPAWLVRGNACARCGD